MKKFYSREFFTQAILILLITLLPQSVGAGFLGGTSANVGEDWTNSTKTVTTTGNVNAHDVTATGKVTTTEGVVYNQGDTNAVNTTVGAKLAVQVIADTDYTSLALAISDAGSTPTKLNICQENTMADGTTLTPPTTMVLDFDCGGSIKGVAGGGTETFVVGHVVNNLNKKIFGADLSVDFATFRPAEISAKWFGDTYVQATITSALTAIGTTDLVTLKIDPSTWVISTSLNMSTYTNITFKIPAGAVLQIATGTTTTFPTNPVADRYQIFNCVGTGAVAGLAIAYPEWFGAKADNSTDSTAGIVAALAAAKVVQGTAGIYKHTGFTLYTDKSILGLGQGTTFFDYTPATGNAVTLAAVAPSTAHRRSRIKDVCLMSTGRSTGWGITTIPGEEQVDIEIGPIVVTDTDKGIWITYPSQGMMITPRLGGRGKTIVGSIGIKIGSTPNTALNMLLIAPYVSSYETAYEAYGYAITLQKPIWEACYTGVKVYGQVHVNHPSANATTDDIYVYANSGYGNLVAYGYVNTGGGANKITYETTAARDRSVVIPISHSSAHPMRIGPHEIGLQNISTNTKVRGNLGTANQTLADNTWTKIALNVETIDEMAEFSTVTGTATITTTGQYLVGGQIAFTTPGDGKRLNAAIYKNGAAICSSEALTGVASAYPTVSTQTFVLLTAADTIELYGRQVSGGAVDVTYGSTATYMYIMRIL